MNDPFGNYLCQKITEVSSDEQFEALASKVRTDTVRICCDPHGTRAMQKLIERAANKLEHIAMIG